MTTTALYLLPRILRISTSLTAPKFSPRNNDILLLGNILLPSTPRLQELVSFQHSLLNCFWESIRANPSDDILLLRSILLPSTPRLQELISFQQFDIKQLQPTIFSSYEVKSKPFFDALLSDICIATSAAPTYLPAHYFETIDPEGNVKDFNLIDGGVAANNPTLLAIGEVTKTIISGSEDFFPIKPMDYGRFLVISLGTGSPKAEFKYRAHSAAKWGLLDWLTSGGGTPIIDVFSQSSSDMVDYHLSVVFQALHSENNYLRIQDDTLTGQVSSVDIADKKNLDDLLKVGEGLLKKPVSRVNLETGRVEPSKHESNEEALTRFAKLLSEEKWLRLAKSPVGHAAKPN